MIRLPQRMPPAVTHALAVCSGALAVLLVPHSSLSEFTPLRMVTIDGGSGVEFNPVGIILLAAVILALLGIAVTLITKFMPSFARMAAIRVLPREITTQAGLLLEEEIARVLSHLRNYGDANNQYLAALTNTQSRLPALPSPDQVRVAMNLLVQENERMRSTSTELKTQLFDSERRLKELKHDQARVEELSRLEPIPGISTRRAFDEALTTAVNTADQRGTALALVMCDVRDFKALNETFGPHVADELLRVLAGLITPNLRFGDLAARYSKEKLGIILPGMTQRDANRFADRIRKELEGQVLTIRATQQKIGKMSADFGAAEWQKGEMGATLVMRASAAITHAQSTQTAEAAE